MLANTFALLLLAFQSCSSCGTTSPQSTNQADEQYAGIESVIVELEGQVKSLTTDVHRKAYSAADLNRDQQVAVVDLSDSMVDSELITRTYLALAVAELELINLSEKTGKFDNAKHTKLLRHVEAVALAIDERVLEKFDIRVFRSLQAGANQALRNEIHRLNKSYESTNQLMMATASPLTVGNKHQQFSGAADCHTVSGVRVTVRRENHYNCYDGALRPVTLKCWRGF